MSLAIETTGLSKSFGPVSAVDSVSLRVKRGEKSGFLGPNGEGKTTTVSALLGWSDRFPWTVPALAARMMGPRSEQMGLHSYLVVLLMFVIGLAATFIWWRGADQAK